MRVKSIKDFVNSIQYLMNECLGIDDGEARLKIQTKISFQDKDQQMKSLISERVNDVHTEPLIIFIAATVATSLLILVFLLIAYLYGICR